MNTLSKYLSAEINYGSFWEEVRPMPPETTSAPARVSFPQDSQIDYMCFASVNTSTEAFSISAWESTDFRAKLNYWAFEKERDINELKSVVTWQKRCLDYQSVYNAYLLGAISESEFEDDTDAYTTDVRDVSKSHIALTVERLSRLLEFKFSISDLASYLQTDAVIVSEVIASLNQKTLSSPSNLLDINE